MGPDGDYLVQHSGNTRIFWADRHELALGACFKAKTGAVPRELLPGVGQPLSYALRCPLPDLDRVHAVQDSCNLQKL